MPTKENNIALGAGAVCFKSGEGEAWLPVNGIQEVSLEPDEEYADTAEPCILGVDLAKEASFTCEVELKFFNYSMFRKYAKWTKTLKRLAHLATCGKNRRIRKKNVKRLVTVYESGYKAIKL